MFAAMLRCRSRRSTHRTPRSLLEVEQMNIPCVREVGMSDETANGIMIGVRLIKLVNEDNKFKLIENLSQLVHTINA
jgi:hypothetical protein